MPPKKRKPKVPKKHVKAPVDIREKISAELAPMAKKEWAASQKRVLEGKVPAHLGSVDFIINMNSELIGRLPLSPAEKKKASALMANDGRLTLYMFQRIDGQKLERKKLLESIERAKKQLAELPEHKRPKHYLGKFELSERVLRARKEKVVDVDKALLDALHDTNLKTLIHEIGATKFRLMQAVVGDIQKALGMHI